MACTEPASHIVIFMWPTAEGKHNQDVPFKNLPRLSRPSPYHDTEGVYQTLLYPMAPTAMWWKVVTITMAFMAYTAVAQNASNIFTLDSPTAFGSGCEHGEVQVVPSVDQRSFSILFSDFESSTTNGTISRKACSVVVPVNATSGYSVGFFQIDYRGFVYVPSDGGAYARLSNEYFFAGQEGAKLERRYGNGTDSEILETSTINIQSVIWSPCGGSANFRINTSITAAKKRGSPEDTIIQIDSIDGSVQGQVKVYLTTRKCEDA